MMYKILQECFTGHRCTLRPMPYTERGFATRHKARHYLDKHGRRFSPRIVREDRVSDVVYRFDRQHN